MRGHVLALLHALSLTMPQRFNQGYYGYNLFLFQVCHPKERGEKPNSWQKTQLNRETVHQAAKSQRILLGTIY